MTAPTLSATAMDTLRRALLALPADEFNSLIEGVRSSRLVAATATGPLPVNTRIRMNSTIRPTYIAGKTALITGASYSGKKGWVYTVKFDGSGAGFRSIDHNSFVVHEGDPIPAQVSPRRQSRYGY